MNNYIAYLDESGAHGFDFTKQGTSTHFVICAIIIDKSKETQFEDSFKKLLTNHVQSGELKSSKISDDSRRLRILEDIDKLDFKFVSLVVDKRKILPDTGLQYKEVFYKFLYGILYNNLFKTFGNLEIVADELINNEFLNGFKNYVLREHVVDLFNPNTFEFKNSKSVPIIQLADFVGGTINRFFSAKSTLNVKNILAGKSLSQISWPQNFKPFTVEKYDTADQFGEIIEKLAILRIDDYLNKNPKPKDSTIQKRVYALNYLKSIYLYNHRNRYIHASEIIAHIETNVGEKITEQHFKQQIIAPLRSQGILISSNSGGYKIPCSTSDMLSFFNLFSRTINPMIERMKNAYESLYTATNGELDILNYPEFDLLRKIIESK